MTGIEAIVAAVEYIEQHPDEYCYSIMLDVEDNTACILGRACLIKSKLDIKALEIKYAKKYLELNMTTSDFMQSILDVSYSLVRYIGYNLGNEPKTNEVRDFVRKIFDEHNIEATL